MPESILLGSSLGYRRKDGRSTRHRGSVTTVPARCSGRQVHHVASTTRFGAPRHRCIAGRNAYIHAEGSHRDSRPALSCETRQWLRVPCLGSTIPGRVVIGLLGRDVQTRDRAFPWVWVLAREATRGNIPCQTASVARNGLVEKEMDTSYTIQCRQHRRQPCLSLETRRPRMKCLAAIQFLLCLGLLFRKLSRQQGT